MPRFFWGKMCRKESRRGMGVVPFYLQTVVALHPKSGLLLETFGKARQKGRAGDYIEVEVKITNATRRIMAKVNEDGTVEPVF